MVIHGVSVGQVLGRVTDGFIHRVSVVLIGT